MLWAVNPTVPSSKRVASEKQPTERDSNSLSACLATSCGLRKREYCYEEGSFRGGAARSAAGFAATRRSWSKQAVIDEILDRYHAGRSLSSGRAENTNLAAVAIRYFGSWRQAIAAAGLPSQRTDNKGA